MSRSLRRCSVLLLALGILWPEAARSYDVVEVRDGGTITGQVTFSGEIPKLEPLTVPKDADFCGPTVPSEALVVSPKSKGVKNTVVYLEEIAKGKDFRSVRPILDNAKCLMAPHVLGMVKGTDLAIKNSDPLLHNMHAVVDGKAMVFNLALPIQGQTIARRVRKTGMITVTCDSHTHMRAHLLVLDHPYFAITDENGAFALADVPPGKYKLVVWHESWKLLGYDKDKRPLYDQPIVQTREIEVPAKGTVRVNFELK
ncbi:MAG: hypothetical protein HY725_18810 [Candidatus Rokubacteria bacterium]|nr:hypothetical protein [Candidatus Rokubacteria bacterium]